MTTPADSNLPQSAPLSGAAPAGQAQQKSADAVVVPGSAAHKTGDVAVAAQIKPSSEDQQLAIRYLSRPMEATHVKSDIPVGRMIASLKETPDGLYQVVLKPRQPLAKGGNATLDAMMQKGIDQAESRIKTKTYTKEEIQQFAKLESEFDKKWEADFKTNVGRVNYQAFEISTQGAFEFLEGSERGSFLVRDNPDPENEGSKVLYYRNGSTGVVTRENWTKGENGKMSVVREYFDSRLNKRVKEVENTEFSSFEQGLASAHMHEKINLDRAITKQDVEDREFALEYFKNKNPQYKFDKLVVTFSSDSEYPITINREIGRKGTQNQTITSMTKQGFEDYAILQRFKNGERGPRYAKYLERQEAERQKESAAVEEADRKRKEAAAAQSKQTAAAQPQVTAPPKATATPSAASAVAPAPVKPETRVQEMNAKEMLEKLGVKDGKGTPGAFVVTKVTPRSYPDITGPYARQKDFNIAINYCDKKSGQLKKIFVAQEGETLYVVGSDKTWRPYSANITSYLESLANEGVIDIDKQK
jgi:hypothetical protein